MLFSFVLSFPVEFQERGACLGAVVPLTQSHRGSPFPSLRPSIPLPPCLHSFLPLLLTRLSISLPASILAIFNPPPSHHCFHGLLPIFPLLSQCALQMHQPGVRSCFLFHVRVILTGPQPNESFPERYSEKITFRVWRESNRCNMNLICPAPFFIPMTLWWNQAQSAHTCTHNGSHTHTAHAGPLCASCFILYFTGRYLGSTKPQAWLKWF